MAEKKKLLLCKFYQTGNIYIGAHNAILLDILGLKLIVRGFWKARAVIK